MARASHRKRWPGFGPGCRFHLSKASKFASSDLLQIINIFCLFHHFPILLRAKRAGFEFSSRFVFENIAGFFSRVENRCDFFNSLVEFAFLVISSHLIQRGFFFAAYGLFDMRMRVNFAGTLKNYDERFVPICFFILWLENKCAISVQRVNFKEMFFCL